MYPQIRNAVWGGMFSTMAIALFRRPGYETEKINPSQRHETKISVKRPKRRGITLESLSEPGPPRKKTTGPSAGAALESGLKSGRRDGKSNGLHLKLRPLLLLLLVPMGIIITSLASGNAEFVEKVYSQKIYPVIARFFSSAISLVPFSLAELLIVMAIISVLAYICVTVTRTIKLNEKRYILQFFINIAAISSAVYFAFVLSSGMNYHRYPFSFYSELTVRPSTSAELAALCAELIDRAAELRSDLPESEGVFRLFDDSYYDTAERAQQAFEKLASSYDVLAGRYSQPKPVTLSIAMSRAELLGVYFPFTFEANINIDAPDLDIPVTMCHEQAHQRGFMREDEANFIAYLACMESGYADFEYSGIMLALTHSMNALYSHDYEAFLELRERYSREMEADLIGSADYWARYDQKLVAVVSEFVNETYLRANSQLDGVMSYGRVVDLLLADYRQRHNIE